MPNPLYKSKEFKNVERMGYSIGFLIADEKNKEKCESIEYATTRYSVTQEEQDAALRILQKDLGIRPNSTVIIPNGVEIKGKTITELKLGKLFYVESQDFFALKGLGSGARINARQLLNLLQPPLEK